MNGELPDGQSYEISISTPLETRRTEWYEVLFAGYLADGVLSTARRGADDFPLGIKRLISAEPEAAARLEREQAAYALLARVAPRPPYFPRFYGRGSDHLAMEWIEGGAPLKGGAWRGLPVEQQLRLFQQLLGALRALQDVGIIHRDIKPTNVLAAGDKLYVVDFSHSIRRGADASTAHGLTATNHYVGTEPWIAPDQRDGNETYKSDVYAAGLLATYAVTGKMPKARKTPPTDGLPDKLREVVAQCLAEDVDARPSAREAGVKIQLMLGQAGVPARGRRGAAVTDRFQLPPSLIKDELVHMITEQGAGDPTVASPIEATRAYEAPGRRRPQLSVVVFIVALIILGAVVAVVLAG